MDNDNSARHSPTTLYQIGKWGGIAIIAYYLISEHQAHVIQALPFLFLLACPLMHFFMHGKHNHTHHDQNKEKQQ